MITIRPLSPALGAEIAGVDLREELDTPTLAIIDAAWLQHHLLLFRNQWLTPEEQIRFSTHFGPVSHQGTNMKQRRDYMHISNAVEGGAFGEGELLFHSDHCFFESVMKAISLHAIEVPPTGGDTIFANAMKAYELLSDELKASIAGRSARHMHTYAYNRGDRRLDLEELGSDAVVAVHPVAWPHPESGRPILFVNELMTRDIVGLDPQESDDLLVRLWQAIKDPRVIYQHRWQLGDLVIWDNRALQHARTNFDPLQKRTMQRVPIAGPVGALAQL